MPVALKEAVKDYETIVPGPITDNVNKHNLEVGRLESFSSSWQHADDSICSRKIMSKAGFYYTGKNDCVKCFVCQIKLGGWNPDEDDPWQKHSEASPRCLFAKLAKEEGQLTVSEWLDIFCDQACHLLESKLQDIR